MDNNIRNVNPNNIRNVFDIRQKPGNVSSPSNSLESNRNESVRDNNDYNDSNFLCLLYKNGFLGAAYYNFAEKTLNVYEEMPELSPRYIMTATLIREVAPKHILTFGNPSEEFVKTSIELFTSDSDTTNSTSITRLPENFYLVSLKEFSYEACKTIVTNIDVASNSLENTDVKQEVYVRSVINMNHRLSVQALGAIYKYLEKHWSMFGVDHHEAVVLHIQQVTLRNHVLIDHASFKALHIFSPKAHDAGFKRGDSSHREGLSLYKFFVYACKSKMGQAQLRNILLSPINDKKELEKRLSFLTFALNPSNMDIIANIQDNIKQFKNVAYVGLILAKIQNERATNKDWFKLHKMIYHTIFINDISRSYREQSELFQELNCCITENLLRLQESIANALDFNAGSKKGRPVIKFGLDVELDAKLLRERDVVKHVTAAARFAVDDLPSYINECKIVYLPEMGHLMAIKEWQEDCDPDHLQDLGYQFMFSIGGVIHYKNPLCIDLDRRLGDINAEIIDHENRILRRLSALTTKYNKDIRDALKIVALLDCLIAMSKVSQQNNYVKPNLNEQRVHEIQECRHPLLERILTSFETNDYFSGGTHSCVKVITGPNGSGKSIFLKQIFLTIYLAHVGCYVPAKKADIGLVSSMHCRLHTNDAAVVRLSSFMTDIAQTSQAFFYNSPSSLIILDEFGKGTVDKDGIILLAAFLKSFLLKKDQCPHILVSTHLQRIATLLPETPYLEYMKMEHVVENGHFCFLYKMSKGVSSSFAFDVASTIVSSSLIKRSKYYFDCLQHNKPIAIPEVSEKIQRHLLNADFEDDGQTSFEPTILQESRDAPAFETVEMVSSAESSDFSH
ncbi:mutS protein homolog 5-like [Anthonomus grandis grandis]|uniref:mutS protein homolog 5-like n=1 Tax=Anthonomus grandis grandis TaxID=2921223 RepID=UPI002165BB81|nr:mutS protein homolog 5-like [Anthonomus grandis grandis]